MFYHLCDPSVSHNVASVDESVQHLGGLFYQVALVWVFLQVVICEITTTKS